MSNGNFNSFNCSSFPWISITGDRWTNMPFKQLKKKKTNLVFFCEKYIKETLSGQFVCKTTSFRLFFWLQLRNANASCSIFHFAAIFGFVWVQRSLRVRAYIWRKWVLMSIQTAKCHMIVQMRRSGRKRTEVSGDDHSDGGPGFLDPTRWHSRSGM